MTGTNRATHCTKHDKIAMFCSPLLENQHLHPVYEENDGSALGKLH